MITENKSNKGMALKLHLQFAHPTPDKLINLINNAGIPWSNNNELKEEIQKISENCSICKIYRKTPPRPVVGLPMTTAFQEAVAMDLKFYRGKILLHLVDHCNQLCTSNITLNKNPDTIIKAIFRTWIAIYGSVQKVLKGNGGEFANNEFLQICESLGIAVKTTSAESPWSNDLME